MALELSLGGVIKTLSDGMSRQELVLESMRQRELARDERLTVLEKRLMAVEAVAPVVPPVITTSTEPTPTPSIDEVEVLTRRLEEVEKLTGLHELQEKIGKALEAQGKEIQALTRELFHSPSSQEESVGAPAAAQCGTAFLQGWVELAEAVTPKSDEAGSSGTQCSMITALAVKLKQLEQEMGVEVSRLHASTTPLEGEIRALEALHRRQNAATAAEVAEIGTGIERLRIELSEKTSSAMMNEHLAAIRSRRGACACSIGCICMQH